MGMTEAEMDAADPKELAAKVKKATDILVFNLGMSHTHDSRVMSHSIYNL